MDRKKVIHYWLDSAEKDFQTVEHLFESRDYHWGLFIGHLVLEKLFKALYASRHDNPPPRTHDLARLAQQCDLSVDDDMMDKLEMISRFNLSVRYPDYQQEIYKICTPEFSNDVKKNIEEIKAWLLELIPKS